jgi:hypothetical protein
MSEYHISETGAVRKHPTRTFTRHFETTAEDGIDEIVNFIRPAMQRFNSKKLGRHRRGTVQLVEFQGLYIGSDRYRLSLMFTTGSRYFYVQDFRSGDRLRFHKYGLIDFRPLLRRLSR